MYGQYATPIALVMLDAHLGGQLDLITRTLLYHLEVHAEESDWDDVEIESASEECAETSLLFGSPSSQEDLVGSSGEVEQGRLLDASPLL